MRVISDIDGLKAAIREMASDEGFNGRKMMMVVASPSTLIGIINSFEEPLTVARIVAGDLIHLIDFDALHIWLEEHEYDGLWNETGEPHCGCDLDDFCPCGCPQPDCRPAYRHSDGMMYLEDEKDV